MIGELAAMLVVEIDRDRLVLEDVRDLMVLGGWLMSQRSAKRVPMREPGTSSRPSETIGD